MANCEWSNLSEVEFLSVELPANIIIRNWKWKATFQNYIDGLEKRVTWWHNANPEKLRTIATELRDFRPDIRVIDDRRVRVRFRGGFRTVIVPVPVVGAGSGPAIEAGGFRTGKPLSRG